jgi:hypothetical protein
VTFFQHLSSPIDSISRGYSYNLTHPLCLAYRPEKRSRTIWTPSPGIQKLIKTYKNFPGDVAFGMLPIVASLADARSVTEFSRAPSALGWMGCPNL